MKNNKIKNPIEQFAHVIFVLLSLAALLPFVLMFISSLTDDNSLLRDGYSFFPKQLSSRAYEYLWMHKAVLGRGYGITVLITLIGTTCNLTLTTMLAYVLSRKDFALRNIFTFFIFFTMLFNGGLVPTYLFYTQYLHIKNTIFALLIPGLMMNSFWVLITRTFFKTNIPDAVIESAVVDGATKFKIFRVIALPLSLPILATLGLFAGIAYWNDWYNGLIYLTEPKLFSIQNILNRILQEVQYLANTVTDANVAEAASKIPTASIRMAIAAIGIIPILCAYPFFQKYFVKGITIGAVKG